MYLVFDKLLDIQSNYLERLIYSEITVQVIIVDLLDFDSRRVTGCDCDETDFFTVSRSLFITCVAVDREVIFTFPWLP